jgi:hypothetical protein
MNSSSAAAALTKKNNLAKTENDMKKPGDNFRY